MIRVLGALLAALIALAVPVSATEQRPDGFGGGETYRGPHGDRSCDALGMCRLTGHAIGPEKQVYEVWTCANGQVIFWPTTCFDDPTHPPCKET